jgi:hypothetical protein
MLPAAGEESGPQATALRQARVADRVYAAVQAQQPFAPDPQPDRAFAESAGPKLRGRDDAVLARCERRDSHIRARCEKPFTVVGFSHRAPEDAPAARRRGRL